MSSAMNASPFALQTQMYYICVDKANGGQTPCILRCIHCRSHCQLATRREKIKNDFIFDNRKQFMTDYNIKISTDFKDKRFSFFADPLLPYWAIRVVCHRSFAHLAACSRTKLIHEGSQKSKSATHIFFLFFFECN